MPESEHLNSSAPNSRAVQLQYHYIPSISASVAIRELPSRGLSFQLWPAASTLVSLFDSYRSQPADSILAPVFSKFEHLNILEIGSGTGLVGITAALTLGATVTITDLPHVVENLNFNVDVNKEELDLRNGTVRATQLRWGDDSDAEALGRRFNVLVGSDIVYHDHLFEPLITTLRWFICGEEVIFLMAHLKRWRKESTFFKMARKLFNVEVLHVDHASGESRVGVLVYKFSNKQKRCS